MATLEQEKNYARVVESNLPLSELKPYFADWGSVLEYHADEMALRYSVHVYDEACQACGTRTATERRKFAWTASYVSGGVFFDTVWYTFLSLFFRHPIYHAETMTFSTVNCLCKRCSRGIRIMAWAGKLLGFACAGLFWITLVGLCVAVCFEIYHLSARAEVGAHIFALKSIAVFGGSMVLAVWGSQVRRKWGVPFGLRRIAKSPFVLRSVHKV